MTSDPVGFSRKSSTSVGMTHLANRFIFITGFGADKEIREFLDARRLKHLIKPFPIQELTARVKELLAEKR